MHRLIKSRASTRSKNSVESPNSSTTSLLNSQALSSAGFGLQKPAVQTTITASPLRDEPLVEDFQERYLSDSSSHERHLDPSLFYPPAEPASSKRRMRAEALPHPNTESFVEAPPPPDFSGGRNTRIPIHTRTSSISRTTIRLDDNQYRAMQSSNPTTPHSYDQSSVASTFSAETGASSTHTLPPLQAKGLPDELDQLEPLMEDDPANFDLVAAPSNQTSGVYQLETRADLLISSAHLELIFSESKSLLKFTGFLNSYRPHSIPILIFYLDALKALRAIAYANAIAEALEPIPGHEFTRKAPNATLNPALQEKANQAFEVLVREDLPAYVAHVWIQVVSLSIHKRITGTMAPHLREASEGLAEVFCLTDPSRVDNPIVFASEEFHRTTQYGMSYAIGRNCRFLQGPRTNPHSVRRLAEACKNAKELSEVFVNYRRDGSPFMNLLMVAPLFDSRGTLRYFIGAQVDVSGLLKDGTDTGLDAFANLIDKCENPNMADDDDNENQKDEFQSLSEMFNISELETVRTRGGSMHRDQVDDSDRESIASHRPRLLLKDPSSDILDQAARQSDIGNGEPSARLNGRLEGVYQHYLLVRPAPSLRILFTSPSLRVPGILQSPFLHRIGGSQRVRFDLAQAMEEGRGVTAKVRWLTKPHEAGEGEGRSRWIHATPLYGHTGSVGVWMIVLVEEDGVAAGDAKRRFRSAPPITNTIGGKEYDPHAMRMQKERQESRLDKSFPHVAQNARYPRPEESTLSGRNRRLHIATQDVRRPESSMSEREAPSELSFQLR